MPPCTECHALHMHRYPAGKLSSFNVTGICREPASVYPVLTLAKPETACGNTGEPTPLVAKILHTAFAGPAGINLSSRALPVSGTLSCLKRVKDA